MSTNPPRFTPVYKTNGTKKHKGDQSKVPSDNDWTRAIHHELNIKRRTCTTFIPKASETSDASRSRDDVQCVCNRLRREHSWDILEENNSQWNRQDHTKSAYNNAYGCIPQTEAHYIRCDIETDPKILAELMFDVWKVKKPQLIMCIIGGAKYFKLSERLEREFIKGIIQAALKADSWIVTTGFKTGVVKLVGEAIHDYKVTNPGKKIIAIGCSKWGGTKNRESLILKKTSTIDTSIDRAKTEGSQQVLEPNHTHFLLIDDGTYYKYDVGDYRTRFVIAASQYKEMNNVPVVTIVVEGGPDTLTTIHRDLRSRIPVVLIDGSGRVPDLLANFLARTESMINQNPKDDDTTNWKQVIDIKDKNDLEKLEKKFHPYADEIRSRLKDISKGSKTSEKEMNKLFHCVLYCLQPAVRSIIQVYSLDGAHDLDDTIFEAIIQAKQERNVDTDGGSKSSKGQLLTLALAWDAIEVAKEHIIKDDLSDLDEETKENLFLKALKLDRPHFVDTFIKLNFNISKIFYKQRTNEPWKLVWKKLAKLYTENSTKKRERRYLLGKCLGKPQISSAEEPDGISSAEEPDGISSAEEPDSISSAKELDGISSKEELDGVLRKLIGDYMKSIYNRPPDGILGRLLICCRCPQGARVADSRAHLYRDDGDESEVPDPEETEKEVRELVYRDLFFWSILTNRIEMSKVLMSHMQTRICAALLASKVLKSYQNLASDNESKEVLCAQADQFEEYANESLKCCYNFDEETACEIAIRRINLFGGVSCLQVAVDADDKHFVGQPCCDQLLNNIWYDKMESNQSTVQKRVRLILSVCTFGLLAPLLISFRHEKLYRNHSSTNRETDFVMTLNQTEEEQEMKKALLTKSTKRLNDHGINYSNSYMWRINFCSQRCLTYFCRLKHFHEAPYIKFLYDAASYIFFLLLFSYYLLFNFQAPTDQTPSIHWTEILVIIIVSTMLIEDIRKFLCQDNRSIVGKLSNYFIRNLFISLIRVASYTLFYLGLILRFTHASDDEDLSAAKIILAYDLEIWFIRSLAFLGVARQMGPKLVMIRRMLIDLSFFIYIILIAMIGYGVASRVMYDYSVDTNTGNLTFDGRSIFRHIIYPTYYLMYGSQDNELAALDQNPDAATAIATQVLLAFHMLFVNILLINLLIAMFSFTFESVQCHTDLVWRFERYALIRQYFDRPALFPPLIIITHCIELIKLILRHLPNRKPSSNSTRRAKTFKMIGINREIDKNWSEFESYATNLYARTVVAGQPLSASVLVPSKAQQEAVQTTSDTMNISPSNFDVKAMADEIVLIKRTIGDLRTYAEEMNRCMQWMMNAMERVKMSREPKPILTSAVTTNSLQQIDE